MANLYLINENTFKDYEDISMNVKPERLLVFVKKMQDLDLKIFLGHPLYYDFIKYATNSGIAAIQASIPTTTAGDGVYNNEPLITTFGQGVNAMGTFIIENGVVKSAKISLPGVLYDIDDTFTCAALPGAIFSVTKLSTDVVFIPDTPEQYLDLFYGTTNVDRQGHTIVYEGLVPTLIYFTFARFIEGDHVRYTSTGPVTKDHDQAKGITVSDTVKLVQQQRSVANAHANEVQKFFYDNRPLFPLWRFNEKNKSSRQAGPRIRGIDKTNFNYPNGANGYGTYNGDYFDIGGLI